MKSYKIFDGIQKAANGCKNAFNKMANSVEDTKQKCMVKRLKVIDKEQEYLRSQLGRRIQTHTPAQV